MEHAIMCPQCNAPLAPHRFARSVVCAFCGATVQLDESSVSAAQFHAALHSWNSPESYQLSAWISIGESHWALERCIAHGQISDVYTARRARWPTELVLVKLLRDSKDRALFDNEWQALQALQASQAPGADTFTRLLPQPVTHGETGAGLYGGQRASVFRWASGFYHTFEEVRQAYPQGIPPQASIWVWRRVLEVLSFIHASGMVHAAVLPPHLLVQENEHGVRLVGYSAAACAGEKLRVISEEHESFYPEKLKVGSGLSAQTDLVMSARCIAALLGGDAATGSVPAAVPARLAGLVQRVARSGPAGPDAWALREELGAIAREAFGPPKFIPIVMPS